MHCQNRTSLRYEKLKKLTYERKKWEFWEMLMLKFEPILASFKFLGLHKLVDVYSTSIFESMHNLSGVSCVAKKCLWNTLRDDSRKTFSIKAASGSSQTFEAVKRSVLSSLNKFLFDSQKLLVYGVQLNFQKLVPTSQLNELFTETDLAGMLQAFDCDTIETVLPFIGAMVDECCNFLTTAEIMKVFAKCVDSINLTFQRHQDPRWARKEISLLEE